MNIAVTGFMGTGKSVVGKALAKKLGWEFFDTDSMIEAETGVSISEIFARRGEPYFRDLETETIRLLCLLEKTVISCGGGAVLRPENMEELESSSVIICLTATPEIIFERVKNDVNRPLLQGNDPQKKIRELLEQRKEQYKRCHIMIDTGPLSIEATVEKILNDPMVAGKIKG
jgi:shikimate kinase